LRWKQQIDNEILKFSTQTTYNNLIYIVPELPLFKENKCNAPVHLHTIKILSFVVKLYFHPNKIILKDWMIW
jgi:hypothetical protein